VATTDAAGGVQSELTYEPFGNTEISAPAPAYRFTGREDDEPLYLYYYRARYYHTDLQRFISEDPIEFDSGDVNLYAYVRNSPTNFTDATGLILEDRDIDPELRAAFALVKSTKRGSELVRLMQADRRRCKLVALPGVPTGGARPRGTCEVYVDPNALEEVPTLAGRKLASTVRILAHEMGHAATGMILESQNIPLNENPIVEELGLSPRIYPDPPGWWYWGTSRPTRIEQPRRR
jgi:RHS repeat-associated protein